MEGKKEGMPQLNKRSTESDVDMDPTWRERNDVAPGIEVHQTLEATLAEITSAKKHYPVLEADPDHPLRINMFQDDRTFQQLGIERLPGRAIFCATPELRDRVIAAVIGELRPKKSPFLDEE